MLILGLLLMSVSATNYGPPFIADANTKQNKYTKKAQYTPHT